MPGIDSSVAIDPRGHSATTVALAGEGRALTEQMSRFVTAFTNDPGAIGNASEAARRAGYSEHSAREIGRQLLDKPHVQIAIREANQQLISGTLATKAISLLEKVIDDASASLKVRVDAARTILDRAGFCALPAGPKRLSDKALAEMTADELHQVMVEARREMDKARIIDGPAVVVDQTVTVTPTTDEPEGTRK